MNENTAREKKPYLDISSNQLIPKDSKKHQHHMCLLCKRKQQCEIGTLAFFIIIISISYE